MTGTPIAVRHRNSDFGDLVYIKAIPCPPRLDGGLWNARFGPAKQQAEMRAGVGCEDKMVIDFEEKRGPAVRALSAYDAVDGSHRRHLEHFPITRGHIQLQRSSFGIRRV